ncbi:MAG: hypothetical protein Tp136SUR676911_24 [Prokaryotic dsDNA virus sp.]|nr:MAG: hypothetical protein Tp136SUR676911_24 [Prokaryotic dsDNA virus sp.]
MAHTTRWRGLYEQETESAHRIHSATYRKRNSNDRSIVMASLQIAIDELSKRPQTNKGVLWHLMEHKHDLERLMAQIEVVLEQHRKGAVHPVYFMDLEDIWLALKRF